MKIRPFLLLVSSIALAACGGGNSSASSASSSATSASSGSESSATSSSPYGPEDTPTYNWNKGQTIAYTPRPEYTLGTATNDEEHDYEDIVVETPSKALPEDFMWAMDVSSLYDVERHGGKFYGKDGKQADPMKLLKDGGANYVRLRLWNDPYDAKGNSYGGGENDLATTIYLAQRAEAAGLKILLDFHYSDSWADPAKQWVPKAWADIHAKYRYQPLGDFTAGVLNTMKNAGVTVSAVQIGNETNNGMAGMAGGRYLANAIEAGVQTAKSVYPEIKTFVHLTNVTNHSSVTKFLNNLKEYGCESYDAVGLSYYPFWHGSNSNLLEVMNMIVNDYGKEVMVAETSWGFTLEEHPNSGNQFSAASAVAGGYEPSCQGQASELADIVNTLSQVESSKGIGLSYWEPAWLPLSGSGWIKPEGYYYNEHGVDWTTDPAADLSVYSDSSCRSSWANQGLFSYSGKALPSLYTYKHIQDGDKTIEESDIENIGLVEDEFIGSYDMKAKEYNLPTTGKVINSIGKYVETPIVYDEEQYAALASADAGKYTIDGTCGGFPVTCEVTCLYNYIEDPSFENQNTLQGSANEYEVEDPWFLQRTAKTVRVETKNEGNRTGTHYFHWWASDAFTFELSQTLHNVDKGTYALNAYVLTIMANEEGGYNNIGLFYKIGNGERVDVSMKSKCAGYNAGLVLWEIPEIVVDEDDATIQIGMYCDAGAGCWGHSDDWSFAIA